MRLAEKADFPSPWAGGGGGWGGGWGEDRRGVESSTDFLPPRLLARRGLLAVLLLAVKKPSADNKRCGQQDQWQKREEGFHFRSPGSRRIPATKSVTPK